MADSDPNNAIHDDAPLGDDSILSVLTACSFFIISSLSCFEGCARENLTLLSYVATRYRSLHEKGDNDGEPFSRTRIRSLREPLP